MSQLNVTTPFSFLGSIRCVPVSKLTAIDKKAVATAVTLIPGSTQVQDCCSTSQTRSPFQAVGNLLKQETRSTKRVKGSGRKSKFPSKLYEVLQECKSGAIRWSTDGTRIIVRFEEFKEQYLGERFKTANITSFVRQLNLYGFRKECQTVKQRRGLRDSSPTEEHVFHHPSFSRDSHLLHTITRSVSSNSKNSPFHLLSLTADQNTGLVTRGMTGNQVS